jgi:alkanesulfonate monooxygenase SsuD/methylene tetrahydromethanopterin reductase-like flavin-dependent oxidoreductase (luciferase family)
VKFGLLIIPSPSIPPEARFDLLRDLSIRADRADFELVAAGQHFADRDQQVLQPIPLLAALAPSVSLKLLTGILTASVLHPLEVAETVRTLDLISGGRAILGVGAGHRAIEFEAFGVPKSERGQRLEDFVRRVRLLWSEGAVLEGSDFKISIPAPAGATTPIWIAGTSDAGVRRAARVGDAWYVGPGTSVHTLSRQLQLYRETLAQSDRDEPNLQPIRRDIFITDSGIPHARLEDALLRRYRSQERWEYATDLPPDLRKMRGDALESGISLDQTVGEEVIAGSLNECVDQLRRIEEVVGHQALVVVRIGWSAVWNATTSGSELLDEMDVLVELRSRFEVGVSQSVGR